VLELQGHGGPVVMDMLLARVCELGARLARPGEFSERAFLNDKLDLAQAEAIADLIEAGTASAARAALHSLDGAFSDRIQALVEQLIELRVYVEAAIDFPEEEIDFLADGVVLKRLQALQAQLAEVQTAARQGSLLREGMTLVLAGEPNVGKSSLLNALAGRDAAIVTDIPGTTRDVLRERLAIDGLPLHVIDTAGLRESDDPVEAEGIRRARAELERADMALLLFDDRAADSDSQADLRASLPPNLPITLVHNKCDLSQSPAGKAETEQGVLLRISAKTGAGLDVLREHLKASMGFADTEGSGFLARRRHLDALRRASAALEAGHQQLVEQRAGELLAEELRAAQEDLSAITGEFSSEDLLGEIFSSFCIGK
ncbi:MAG: tRNA uridine-5-carboxymethylaminomethyl(34) synthesis GTPase MnmE, partial [Nevskiales bacterium]